MLWLFAYGAINILIWSILNSTHLALCIQTWIYDLQDSCCSPHTFFGYSHFSSITLKIRQRMREILFVGVKSHVRSALNRLNTNWPQTRQDLAVDDVEENCHQEPCPTLEIPVKKKLIKTEARTVIQDSILVIPSRFYWFNQTVNIDLLFFHCLYFA